MTLKVTSKQKKSIKPSVEQMDEFILKRKGGGSIIDQKPLFSGDGETLYVVWKHAIRAYSTTTSDFVKEFELADHKIIGITLSPENSSTLIGCTDNGELIYWNCHNGLITMKTKCSISKCKDDVTKKIKTFHIVNYTADSKKSVLNACISSITKRKKHITLSVELFDLKIGDVVLRRDIEHFNEDYCIDIVGNYGENLICIGQESFLYIFSPLHKLSYNRQKAGRKITCICGHPEEESVATGDISGRVLVWRNISQLNTVRATYHWHTLPVTDITFSKSGGYMYTGGDECVLVKWLLANPENKSFLPRLPAAIRHLTIAPENIYIAVSTADNGITIVNSEKKLIAVIQNFTWGVSSSSKGPFPAGLHVDPRTNSLVLNSRTGHIQFFNTHTKSLLYNMNITDQNIITRERNTTLTNTEVIKVAINVNGSWLATIEEWKDDSISHFEIRLKFWKYNVSKQCFTLNTSIEYPHEVGVNALKFRPKSSLGNDEEYAISVGQDEKFKLWYLTDSEYNESKHWRCHSFGFYRKLPALDAGFSTDGSLVGVSFDSTLTLWDPETNELKNSLSYCLYPQPITRVEFGKQEACHLVVTASAEHLAVWDLFSLSVKWSVPINVTTLTADPLSVYMAVFTIENTLIVFSPRGTEIVYKREKVVENDDSILDACFVPNIQANENAKWQSKSSLYFINSSQELLALETKSESSIALENLSVNRDLPITAFSRILPAEKISNVEKSISYVHDYLKTTNKGIGEMLLTTPAHTLPPMRMLCMPYLLALVGKYNRDGDTQAEPSRSAVANAVDEDSDSDDEKTSDPQPKDDVSGAKDKTVDTDKQDADDMEKLMDYDWDFLKTVLPVNNEITTK
ncbi:WD repeat-containing protein 75 [Copidosoma floridanum]|uniref:WD repeat-containing protein 75 n=1 Tax=Copidosoma floridanum TaxID=29053 RepID=UPI0006C96562|nr:WD repeat-containing protein 75 [Copidosoma floridanum]